MDNESIATENLTENIKASFDNITKIYEESSFLLKDLAAELEKLGYEKEPRGNSIGTTYVSKNINSPRYWLTRYAALFFRTKAKPDYNRLLSTTVIYFDHEPTAIDPWLIVGVGEKSESAHWDYWWMYSAFLNEEQKFNYYHGTDNAKLNIDSPKQHWQSQAQDWGFTVPDTQNNPYHPKAGKLFAVPLLETKSEDVGKLAKRGLKLWNTKFTWNSDSQ